MKFLSWKNEALSQQCIDNTTITTTTNDNNNNNTNIESNNNRKSNETIQISVTQELRGFVSGLV